MVAFVQFLNMSNIIYLLHFIPCDKILAKITLTMLKLHTNYGLCTIYCFLIKMLILLIFQSLKIIRIMIFIKIECFTFTAFADAAIAPIDFPTAPAYAVPKVKYIVWKMLGW